MFVLALAIQLRCTAGHELGRSSLHLITPAVRVAHLAVRLEVRAWLKQVLAHAGRPAWSRRSSWRRRRVRDAHPWKGRGWRLAFFKRQATLCQTGKLQRRRRRSWRRRARSCTLLIRRLWCHSSPYLRSEHSSSLGTLLPLLTSRDASRTGTVVRGYTRSIATSSVAATETQVRNLAIRWHMRSTKRA